MRGQVRDSTHKQEKISDEGIERLLAMVPTHVANSLRQSLQVQQQQIQSLKTTNRSGRVAVQTGAVTGHNTAELDGYRSKLGDLRHELATANSQLSTLRATRDELEKTKHLLNTTETQYKTIIEELQRELKILKFEHQKIAASLRLLTSAR